MPHKDTDLTHLAARKLELDAGISFLRAATADSKANPRPVVDNGGSAAAASDPRQKAAPRVSSSNSRVMTPFSEKQSPHHQTLPVPAGTSSGARGDGGEEAAIAAGRGRSESPGKYEMAQVGRRVGQRGARGPHYIVAAVE